MYRDLSWPFPASMSLGFYFDWNQQEEETVRTLKEEMGFEKPDVAMTHTSCELSRIRGHAEYLFPNRTGFLRKKEHPGHLEFETSMVVRSGVLSRDEGFREMDHHGISSDVPEETIARYLEMTGVSRKYAIPLLEYFDSAQVTVRVGDSRVLRKR